MGVCVCVCVGVGVWMCVCVCGEGGVLGSFRWCGGGCVGVGGGVYEGVGVGGCGCVWRI